MKVRLKLVLSDVALLLCLIFPILYYAVATSHQVDLLRVNLSHAEAVNSAFLDLSEIKRRIETQLFRLQYSTEQDRAQKVIAASQEFRSIILRFRELETSDRLLEGFVDRYTDAELKIIAGYLEIAAFELAGKSSQTWAIRNQLTLLEPTAVVYKTDLSSYLTNLIFDYTREVEDRRLGFLHLALFSLLSAMVVVALRYRLLRTALLKPLGSLSHAVRRVRDGRSLARVPEVPESPEVNELIRSFNEMGMSLEKNRQYREIFAAITAHDLKEPLGAILSLVRLREMEFMDMPEAETAEDRAFIKRIELNSTIGLNMIDALLQLSRSSFREMSYEQIELDQIVTKVFQELQVFHFNKPSKLHIRGSLGVVFGDLRQIETLFRNLFSNSIKFGQPKLSSVDIEVWVTQHEGRHGPLKNIHIKDNGVGFNASDFDRLLKPFERNVEERETKRASELTFMRGVGLGLAVCHRILENHKGHFAATSQIGVGSEFVLSFPALSAEMLEDLRKSQPPSSLY
jgi:signal transduction histidine kinase